MSLRVNRALGYGALSPANLHSPACESGAAVSVASNAAWIMDSIKDRNAIEGHKAFDWTSR